MFFEFLSRFEESGFNELNAHMRRLVVGDYTGLTATKWRVEIRGTGAGPTPGP